MSSVGSTIGSSIGLFSVGSIIVVSNLGSSIGSSIGNSI